MHNTLEDVLLKEYLGNPAPLMWDHGGKCACDRNTFLFGQCDKCAREEAQDRHQEELQRALEPQEEAPDDVLADRGHRSSDHTDHRIDFPTHSIVVTENLDFVYPREHLIVNENAVSVAPFVAAWYCRSQMRVHPIDSLPKLIQKPTVHLTQPLSASQLLVFDFSRRPSKLAKLAPCRTPGP